MNKNMKIRPIVSGEYIFLDDFLYDAIFIPEGVTPPEKSIIQQPELQEANYASKMYLKLGFEIIKTNEEDYIMICKL